MRVIVIDDNADAAELLAELLRRHGHVVITAHDGLDGLEKLEVFKPQIAIVDINMPGLDGLGLATRVRGDDRFRSLRLIALTALSDTRACESITSVGFDHHLVKPTQWQHLAPLLSRDEDDEP